MIHCAFASNFNVILIPNLVYKLNSAQIFKLYVKLALIAREENNYCERESIEFDFEGDNFDQKSSLLGGRTELVLSDRLSAKKISGAPSTRKSRENQLKALPRISVSEATPLFLSHLTLVFFALGRSSTTSENLSEAGIIGTVFFPDKVLHETGLLQAIQKNNEILFWFDRSFFSPLPLLTIESW